MSYSEENGQVVLRMSREDYVALLFLLSGASRMALQQGKIDSILELMNRLNEGNPNYTPYQVKREKV